MDSPRQEIHDNQGYEGTHRIHFSPTPSPTHSLHDDNSLEHFFSFSLLFVSLSLSVLSTTENSDPERVLLNL